MRIGSCAIGTARANTCKRSCFQERSALGCRPTTGEVPTSCPPECPQCTRLRAATLSIVGAEGLSALTDERLAQATGLDGRALAAHYDSAASCLYATYEEVAGGIYQDFARAMAAQPGWYDALRAGGLTLLHRLTARPAEARLCFAEILHGDYELLRRREASRRRLVTLFVRELGRRHQEPEQYRMQLELLIGACFQAIAAAVAERRAAELERLFPELESRAYVFEAASA